MKERPILFSGPMVRAILEDRKTQTRRVAKEFNDKHNLDGILARFPNQEGCPYGKPGDLLWVRETWAENLGTAARLGPCLAGKIIYRADYGDKCCGVAKLDLASGECTHRVDRWRPSIFMPRWASRITLEITGVRVERLQDISGPDCWEEGISHAGWDPERFGSVVECYRDLWQSINAAKRPKLPSDPNSRRYARVKAWLEKHPDTTSWGANPRVWVVEFRRLYPGKVVK